MPRFNRTAHTFLWCLGCAAWVSSCASDSGTTASSTEHAGGSTTQPSSTSTTTAPLTSTTEGTAGFSASTAIGGTSVTTTVGSTNSTGAPNSGNTSGTSNTSNTSSTSATVGTSSDAATSSDAGGTTATGAGGTAFTSTTATEGSTGVGGTEPLGPTKVWIAGDSTVANGNTPCPTGWGKHLKQYLNDLVTIDNSAAGGRSVRTWLYNVTTEMDESTGECMLQRDGSGEPTLQARWQNMLDNMTTGDTLLIQFGINDGSATCDRHVGIEAFKESYGVMAAAAQERGAEPVFITPVSSIACDGNTPRGTRGGYVDATIEAGQEFGVPVIDLHQLSVELYGELGFCPVPGGDVSAETSGPVGDFFCDDHTHFSDSGAVTIAEVVANALREQPLNLARYLNQ